MEAKLYNFKCWVNTSDSTLVKTTLNDFLQKADFEILGFMEHKFQPQGYTCIWLLGESHLAVHTYPEHNQTYVELTSCAPLKNEQFKTLIANHFKILNK